MYFDKGTCDNNKAIPRLKPKVNNTISTKNKKGICTNEVRPLDKYELIKGWDKYIKNDISLTTNNDVNLYFPRTFITYKIIKKVNTVYKMRSNLLDWAYVIFINLYVIKIGIIDKIHKPQRSQIYFFTKDII